MTTGDKIRAAQARQREVASVLKDNATRASRSIGVMLAIPGALDPQDRDLLETAQAVVERFAR